MLEKEWTVEMPTELEILYAEMHKGLQGIQENNNDGLSKSKQCIDYLAKTLANIREFILNFSFKDKSQEISFFKYIKPRFYSEYIYYIKLYQIEILIPTGSHEDEINYLNKELKRLNEYFQSNLSFYQYIRSKSTILDERYFLRNQSGGFLLFEDCPLDIDPRFSTTHDYKVAKIIANEHLRKYLNSALDRVKQEERGTFFQKTTDTQITWTAPKAFLIELIYAFQSFGSFNHGKAEIKDIADYFERVFNINLGNVYRTFQEIRIRKRGEVFSWIN